MGIPENQKFFLKWIKFFWNSKENSWTPQEQSILINKKICTKKTSSENKNLKKKKLIRKRFWKNSKKSWWGNFFNKNPDEKKLKNKSC